MGGGRPERRVRYFTAGTAQRGSWGLGAPPHPHCCHHAPGLAWPSPHPPISPRCSSCCRHARGGRVGGCHVCARLHHDVLPACPPSVHAAHHFRPPLVVLHLSPTTCASCTYPHCTPNGDGGFAEGGYAWSEHHLWSPVLPGCSRCFSRLHNTAVYKRRMSITCTVLMPCHHARACCAPSNARLALGRAWERGLHHQHRPPVSVRVAWHAVVLCSKLA